MSLLWRGGGGKRGSIVVGCDAVPKDVCVAVAEPWKKKRERRTLIDVWRSGASCSGGLLG